MISKGLAKRLAKGFAKRLAKRLAIALAALVAALVLAAPAFAEDSGAPGTGEARYSFHKVADGFLRLDLQTGEVALCSRQAVGWACLAAPEDRAVLEHEIARLRKENAMLEEELLAHDLPLPPGAMPGRSGHGGEALTPRPPRPADFDRVIALVGRIWHRLVAVLAHAQNQVLHRS
jgi:hypothetical protein